MTKEINKLKDKIFIEKFSGKFYDILRIFEENELVSYKTIKAKIPMSNPLLSYYINGNRKWTYSMKDLGLIVEVTDKEERYKAVKDAFINSMGEAIFRITNKGLAFLDEYERLKDE